MKYIFLFIFSLMFIGCGPQSKINVSDNYKSIDEERAELLKKVQINNGDLVYYSMFCKRRFIPLSHTDIHYLREAVENQEKCKDQIEIDKKIDELTKKVRYKNLYLAVFSDDGSEITWVYHSNVTLSDLEKHLQNKNKFVNYQKSKGFSKSDIDAILDRTIILGWDKEKTIMSLGQPETINKTTAVYGTSEQWVYKNGFYVYFDNGRITSVQH